MHFFPSLSFFPSSFFPYPVPFPWLFFSKNLNSRGLENGVPSHLPISCLSHSVPSLCIPNVLPPISCIPSSSTRCKNPILFPFYSHCLPKIFPFLPSIPSTVSSLPPVCIFKAGKKALVRFSSHHTFPSSITLHSFSLPPVCNLRHFNVSLISFIHIHPHSLFHQIAFNSQFKWEGRKGSGSQSSQSFESIHRFPPVVQSLSLST